MPGIPGAPRRGCCGLALHGLLVRHYMRGNLVRRVARLHRRRMVHLNMLHVIIERGYRYWHVLLQHLVLDMRVKAQSIPRTLEHSAGEPWAIDRIDQVVKHRPNVQDAPVQLLRRDTPQDVHGRDHLLHVLRVLHTLHTVPDEPIPRPPLHRRDTLHLSLISQLAKVLDCRRPVTVLLVILEHALTQGRQDE